MILNVVKRFTRYYVVVTRFKILQPSETILDLRAIPLYNIGYSTLRVSYPLNSASQLSS